MLAAATRRGELVALIDALDMFDVESAAEAGIISIGCSGSAASSCRTRDCAAISISARLVQAIRAFTLVLQAGQFGLVAFDAGEAPADAIRRLPFTTWLRLQRMVEGTQTTCLLVGSDRMARSPAGLTLHAPALRKAL